MGEVFAARHERTEQVVALKVLRPEKARSPEYLARFRQEGRALALLEREEVARLLHYEEFGDGTHILVMERLEGESLRQWISARPGPHSLDEALEIGRRLAEIMVKVHARGVIHRDVKPENIFLCTQEGSSPRYRIKMLDFGIAKVPSAEWGPRLDTQLKTQGFFLMGTPTYMAPEQVFPDVADGQADVYSLGVVLFELLSGRPPFEGSRDAVLYMHQKEKPPRLQDRVPGLPEGLCTLIAAMLAKEPGERPSMSHCWRQLGQDWIVGVRDCPIPGLAAFSQTQSELFVGRSRELQELLELLEDSRAGRKRWIQLEGPSGVGKSSLIQAGLMPRLQGPLSQPALRWQMVNLWPTPHPSRGLALALHAALTGFGLPLTPQQLEEALLSSSETLGALVREHLPSDVCLLLVIEQLEELLTLDEAERRRWDGWLCTALDMPSCPLRLLTTLRSDFIPLLRQLPRLERHLNAAARYNLAPLEGTALTHVIQEMAQRVGLSLDKNLPERMVRDAPSEGSRLSLLSHALRELWELRGSGLLTHQHYEGLGGVDGILTRQAETLLSGLDEEGRQRAKWIVLSLVQVSRGLPALRRTRTWREVLEDVGADDQTERVLRQLSGMRGSEEPAATGLRLIVVSPDSEPAQQRVALIHDTLLQNVSFIREWINHERAKLERLTELEATAQAWVQAGRPRSNLFTGTFLKHYLESARLPSSRGTRALGPSEQAARFLEAARRFDQRRSLLRVTLVVFLLGVTLWALWQMQRFELLLRQNIGIMDAVVSNIDWVLGRRAHTLEARRQLLDYSVKQASGILEQNPTRPEVRLITIQALQRMSDLSFHDEQLSQARGLLTRARALIAQGLERQSEDEDLLVQSGLNFSKQGKLAIASGRMEEARALFTQANDCFVRLPMDDTPEGRRMRATSISEFADLDLETGHAAEAVRGYGQAIELLKRNPEAYDRSLLAETLGSRAQSAWRTGDKAAAEDDFQRALKLARSVHRDDPSDTYYQWVLAGILVKRAEFLRDSRADAPLAPLYEEALSLSRTIHEGEAPNKRYALVLARSLLGMERVMRAAQDDTQTTALHAERCRLVDDFMRMDSEDVRFQEVACH